MKEMEGARILVVDDEEGIRKSLKAVLEEEGCLVDTAENGQAAIAKSKTTFYNLVLVDIRLPDMDGVELLTSMGQTTPKMVRIIVTGYPSIDNAIQAVNKGVDGYIVKPFTMEHLLSTVKKHLQKQREAKKYSEEKVKEYVESRAKEMDTKMKGASQNERKAS
jgi:two-component system nitrogen regulation response regulator NtrX